MNKDFKEGFDKGWEEAIKAFKQLIIKEINTAHREGSPSKRLTSLYNKIVDNASVG